MRLSPTPCHMMLSPSSTRTHAHLSLCVVVFPIGCHYSDGTLSLNLPSFVALFPTHHTHLTALLSCRLFSLVAAGPHVALHLTASTLVWRIVALLHLFCLIILGRPDGLIQTSRAYSNYFGRRPHQDHFNVVYLVVAI